jgi:hypothetical protein
MTRKDYIIIADIIIKQYSNKGRFDRPINDLLDPAVQILKQSGGSFDPQKFRNYVLKGIQK